MKEVTIVTAFFDIGRAEFDNFPRTNQQYLDYFKVWGKMKNNLVVYTYKEMAKEVRKIREEFGLLDRTTVIEIENENEIEPEILEKMKVVSKQEDFLNFRYYRNAVSNRYKYDYVMLLKYWCLADAVKKGYAKGMIAWIDFGFNHGDTCYTKPEEFSFLWNTNLKEDRIHLFALRQIDKRSTFRSVMLLNDCIMGCLLILPDFLCEGFWNLIKDSMKSLLRLGFIDDDQLLLLMAYREKESIFEIHVSNWFMPLKENGAPHLTTREKEIKKKKSIVTRVKNRILRKRKLNTYLKQIKEIIK